MEWLILMPPELAPRSAENPVPDSDTSGSTGCCCENLIATRTSRRISTQPTPAATAAELKQRGIEYILVREEEVLERFKCPVNDWLKRMNAQVIQAIPLNLRASRDARNWYLIKLQ
jgi:hypothetical protein